MALLIKRVQMDERFRVDVMPGGKGSKVNILGPKGEPLIIGLDADSADFRRAQRALERMGLRSEDQPPAPQVRQRVKTTTITDPYPNITVYEKAKKVHKGATDYARATGKPIGLYDGVEYFVIDDKPLKYFIGKHYPKIAYYSGPGGTQEIYDFLRSTGNYARERQDDDTSMIIVRVDFAEVGGPVQWRSPRGPVSDWQREQSRKEAKLTAKEAGEDREPAPVTVRKIAVPKPGPTPADAGSAPEPAVASAGDAVPNPEDLRLLAEARARQAALHCPECAAVDTEFVAKNPQGLSAHRKGAHGVEGKTYTPSVVGKITSDSPLAEVGVAFDMLREALSKVVGGIDHAECERETEFQKADAQVQRERAERAETTLACIRTAFDTLPVNKAVAEVLDLLPPVKE